MRNATIAAAFVLLTATLAVAAVGGPDDFGYRFNTAAPYLWIDASSGSALQFPDDMLAGPFPIGFDFDFYGRVYQEYYISSNGRIAFVDQLDTFQTACIPSESPYVGYIALYWDDLDPSAGGVVYTRALGTAPNRYLVVQYDKVPLWSSDTERVTAEIILSEQTGDILLQYQDPTSELGSGASIGLMSPDGSTGLSIGCREAILAPATAILVAHPAILSLAVEDAAVTVESGDVAAFDLTVRNVTGDNATVSFDVSGNTWTTAVAPPTLDLAPGESAAARVEVTVPAMSARWDRDQAAVTATILAEPAVSASVDIVTTAGRDWELIAGVLPGAFQYHAVVTDSEWIYVLSNYDAPGIAGTFGRFDLADHTESLPDLNPAVNVDDGTYLWGNLAFVGGISEAGEISDRMHVYDISDGVWRDGFALPAPVAFAAVVVLNEEIYVIGGYDGEEAIDDVWVFAPGPATWRRVAPLNQARQRPAAGVVQGRIVVAGGYATTALDSVEIYDPVTDAWHDGAPLPDPITDAADGTCNGLFYLIGGQSDDTARDQAYEYDVNLDVWTPIASLQLARAAAQADLLDGALVVAGGMHEPFAGTDSAEVLSLGCADEVVPGDEDFGGRVEGDDDDDDQPPAGDDDDDEGGGCGC